MHSRFAGGQPKNYAFQLLHLHLRFPTLLAGDLPWVTPCGPGTVVDSFPDALIAGVLRLVERGLPAVVGSALVRKLCHRGGHRPARWPPSTQIGRASCRERV